MDEIGICNCARTTSARMRRHADKENKKQDPKPRRQTNLCMLAYCFSSLCLRTCLCLQVSAYLCAGGINARVTVLTRLRNNFAVMENSHLRCLKSIDYSCHRSASSSTEALVFTCTGEGQRPDDSLFRDILLGSFRARFE